MKHTFLFCISAFCLLVACEQLSDKPVSAEYYRSNPPTPPFPYESEEVSFTNVEDSITLKGTLTYPKLKNTSFPAVILMHGTGGYDRDYANSGHKMFLVMADYLTKNGIAVLRYDKRGFGESGGTFDKATQADFASDGGSAVEYLRSRKDLPLTQIGMAGHSEGGTTAPMAAIRYQPDFMILLAAGGMPWAKEDSLMHRRLALARGNTEAQAEREWLVHDSMAKLALSMDLGKSLDDSIYNLAYRNKEDLSWLKGLEGDELTKRILLYYVDYMARPVFTESWNKEESSTYLKKLKCPVLAVSGSLDLNVPGPESIAAIQRIFEESGNPRVVIKLIPDLNHNLQPAKTGLPEEGEEIEITIAPEVLVTMKDFILEVSR